jgi:hypothetical protein
MEATKVARPRHLREALGLAFVHRGRIRWRAGKSGFLGLEYPGDGDGVIVDVGDVPEFREIQSDRHGLKIGAFAEIERVASEPLIRSALGDAPFGPDAARFRLGALGARLIIAGMGATRTARLDMLSTRDLPDNEIPLAVTLAATALRRSSYASSSRSCSQAFIASERRRSRTRSTALRRSRSPASRSRSPAR